MHIKSTTLLCPGILMEMVLLVIRNNKGIRFPQIVKALDSDLYIALDGTVWISIGYLKKRELIKVSVKTPKIINNRRDIIITYSISKKGIKALEQLDLMRKRLK